MPSRKQFESLSLEVPFSIKYLDMFEISDIFFNSIKSVLKYVDENKIACFETGTDNAVYHIMRTDETITVKKQCENNFSVFAYSGIDFINWLFQIAPFISMVGISNTDF